MTTRFTSHGFVRSAWIAVIAVWIGHLVGCASYDPQRYLRPNPIPNRVPPVSGVAVHGVCPDLVPLVKNELQTNVFGPAPNGTSNSYPPSASISASFEQTLNGAWLIPTFASLTLINLLGVPFTSQSSTVELDLSFSDFLGNPIPMSFSAQGRGRATAAYYWGYSWSGAADKSCKFSLGKVSRAEALHEALGTIRDELDASFGELRTALAAPPDAVRAALSNSLDIDRAMQMKHLAIRQLTDALGTLSGEDAGRIALALGRFGDAAQSAVPALREHDPPLPATRIDITLSSFPSIQEELEDLVRRCGPGTVTSTMSYMGTKPERGLKGATAVRIVKTTQTVGDDTQIGALVKKLEIDLQEAFPNASIEDTSLSIEYSTTVSAGVAAIYQITGGF